MAKPIINEVFRIFGYGRSNPYEGKPLTEIPSLAARAVSLIQLHQKNPFMGTGYLNIYGATEMMAGMEYHHDRFLKICTALSEGDTEDESSLYHEAIAYINRMGQFHYFSISPFVRKIIDNPSSMIPTIEKFRLYRNKHTAHRSIDVPRVGDIEEVAENHALSMTRISDIQMTCKTDLRNISGHASQIHAALSFHKFEMESQKNTRRTQEQTSSSGHSDALDRYTELVRQRRQFWKDCYATFEMYDSDGDRYLDFTIEVEHPRIMTESYNLIEAIVLRA